jgi:hypothetical protein
MTNTSGSTDPTAQEPLFNRIVAPTNSKGANDPASPRGKSESMLGAA